MLGQLEMWWERRGKGKSGQKVEKGEGKGDQGDRGIPPVVWLHQQKHFSKS